MKDKPFAFDNNGDSFVITSTDLPKAWYNYFWSRQGYIASVSHLGCGQSRYIDEKANLCRLNSGEVRYLYLRDDESGCCWNVGAEPLAEPVANYRCAHHITHTTIESEKDGIYASIRYFVPFDGCCELWTLKLKNTGADTRKVSIFAVVNFDLDGFDYPRYHEMFRTLNAFYDEKLNGVFCKSAHHWAPHNRYNGYLACSEKPAGSDANIGRFTGGVGSFARPKLLLAGRDCTNSRRSCYDLGGVLQNKIELAPGQEKTLHYIFGLAESLDDAVRTTAGYFSADTVEKTFAGTGQKIFDMYSSLSVKTPDEKINNLMNNWLKKQVDFCIVGKKGVRDNAQITSALLMYRPDKARREILEILRHEYKSGNAVLTWLPLDETRYSDQPFWIIWSVTELIKETGDFSILSETVAYQDGGKGTVFEHLKAAVQRLLDDRGPDGLVKIFFADWNDALNVTDDADAQSVMLSQQFCLALREFAILCDKIGEDGYAAFLREKYDRLSRAVNTAAWDGDWYTRVVSKKGNIGSKNSQGSKIYLNPQVWAALAGLADEKRLKKVLRAVDSMEHDFGFPINKPAYTQYSPHVGRMSLMLAGLYENGGVYCHASAFKMMMDAVCGRGGDALRTLKKIMPDSEKNPYTQSQTEPYVFTNCYSLNPDSFGRADRAWITGTSAWCMKALYEGILGIRRDYDGLRLTPSMPSSWKQAEATRTFRGTRYHIVIKNPDGKPKGRVSVSVDGKAVAGRVLPLFDDDNIHEVEVMIR